MAPPPFRSLPLQVGGLPHLDAVHPPAIEPPSTSKNKPGVFIIGEVHFPPAPWSCVNLACQFVGFMLFWFKPTHPLKILKNIPHDTPTHPGGRPGLQGWMNVKLFSAAGHPSWLNSHHSHLFPFFSTQHDSYDFWLFYSQTPFCFFR